jgi:2'-5' RNA ligase
VKEMRIGVAIEVPAPFGPQLQAARAGFGDPLAPHIPPHITLVGPTEVADLEPVVRHLKDVAASHAPFTVHLRGTGTFRPVSDVVFVQVAVGISECEQLERAVRAGPLDQITRFNYHPHVTVAHDVPDADLDRAFEELADYEASFPVASMHVYTFGDDEVWRAVRDVPLAGQERVAARSRG